VSDRRARGGSPDVAWAAGPARDGVGELLHSAPDRRPLELGVPAAWTVMHGNNDGNRCRGSKGRRGAGRAAVVWHGKRDSAVAAMACLPADGKTSARFQAQF
jgi:hypothetical protein